MVLYDFPNYLCISWDMIFGINMFISNFLSFCGCLNNLPLRFVIILTVFLLIKLLTTFMADLIFAMFFFQPLYQLSGCIIF